MDFNHSVLNKFQFAIVYFLQSLYYSITVEVNSLELQGRTKFSIWNLPWKPFFPNSKPVGSGFTVQG